jgi:hypothetical protein
MNILYPGAADEEDQAEHQANQAYSVERTPCLWSSGEESIAAERGLVLLLANLAHPVGDCESRLFPDHSPSNFG